MSTPSVNIYLVLDLFLDPAEINFDRLKNEVKKKITIWSRNPKQFAHQLQIAQDFMTRRSPPRQDEGGTLDYQARFAREKREAEGKEKAASYEDDGRLEREEVDEHVKEYSRYFQEDTIKSWFTLAIDEGGEYVFEPPGEPKYPVKIVSDKDMRKIGNDLRIIFGNEEATLYDLLKASQLTDISFLQQTAKADYERVQGDPMKGRDETVDAKIRALGEAMTLFKDVDSKQGYDIALSHRSFYQLVEKRFKGRALKGWIMVAEYQTSVKEVCDSGLPEDEANWLVYNYYCNTRSCPHPKRTNDEEVAVAKKEAEQAKEKARQEIEAATEKANARIAEARKDAQNKVDAAEREKEAGIKTAQERATRMIGEAEASEKAGVKAANERADRQIADARSNENDAIQKRFAAEKAKEEAEEIAGNAMNLARREFADEKAAATAARLAAEEDQRVAQEKTDEAHTTIRQAEQDVNAARMLQHDAENTADREIANARSAEEKQRRAERIASRSILATTVIVVFAGFISLYSIYHGTYSASVAATATGQLAEYVQTFDSRLSAATNIERDRADEAVRKADVREAEAVAKFNSADQDHKRARELQIKADEALANAMKERTDLLREREAVAKQEATATSEIAKAREDQRIAEEATTVAGNTMNEANQRLQEARVIVADAERRIANAERNEAVARATAARETERRMGIEAMIEAGAPLRFPLEDNERGDTVWQQGDVLYQPVSHQATPLSGHVNPATPSTKTTKDIFRDITWRWCLEKEFGIENELGELVGEVTGKPRTGYRESKNGSLVAEKSEFPQEIRLKFSPISHNPREDYERILSNLQVKSAFGAWDESIWTLDGRRMLAMRGYDFNIDRRVEKENIIVRTDHPTPIRYDVAPCGVAKLDRRFMLAEIPVTQELWESVMGNNPSRFVAASRPVENVSWEDCQEFLAKLNEMKEELGVPHGYDFTLPFEYEWEHACRAGRTTPFYFGWHWDDERANGNKNRWETSIVGKYPHNRWGLYDMHGNVWEWCQDEAGFGPLLVEGRENVLEGFYRSRRGGSWKTSAENCQSAYRSFGNPKRGHDDTGLRLCLAASK